MKKLFLIITCVSPLIFSGCLSTTPPYQETFSNPEPQESSVTSLVVSTNGISHSLNTNKNVFVAIAPDARDGYGFVENSGSNLWSFMDQSVKQHTGSYTFGYAGESISTVVTRVKELNINDVGAFNANIRYIIIPKFKKTEVNPENIFYSGMTVGSYVQKVGSFSNEFVEHGKFITNIDIVGSVDIEILFDIYDITISKTKPIMSPVLTCHADNWHLTSIQPLNNRTDARMLLDRAKDNANFYSKEGLTNYIVSAAFEMNSGFMKPFIIQFVDKLFM